MPRPGGRNFEKSKDFKGSIKRLLSDLSNFKILLIIALTLAMVSSILSLIAPNKLSDLTDTVTAGIKPNISEKRIKNIMTDPNISMSDKMKFTEVMGSIKKSDDTKKTLAKLDTIPKPIYNKIKPSMDMAKVESIALFLCIMYLVSSLFSYIQGYLMTTVSNGFAKDLRSRISNKINILPLKYFDQHETGDVLSRITNDVDTIAQNLNQSLGTLVSSITLFIGSIIMMFITNWIMAISAILASLIGFGLMGAILGKSQKYFVQRQKELGNLNGYIEEVYSGHNVVKAYNGDKESNVEFDKLNSKLYECNRKSQFLSGLMPPIMGFIGNFGYVVVCVVGALLVTNNVITFGVIVAFMIYVRLFTNPLSQIAQAMTSLQSTVAASERVFEFLDEEEEIKETDTPVSTENLEGNITFDHVKFGYQPEKTIIKDFNAKVKQGQKVAIVGPTGAGKTTMVKLLMRFYDINSGSIKIDGHDIKDFSRQDLRRMFGMVLQDTWLFSGSIEDNVKYGNMDATFEDVEKACREAHADHFIKTLPDSYHMVINEEGNNISQGQKQLLTIARVILENPKILILDEATSSVDTRTEEHIQKAMDELMKNRTSFIIAHRLSTIRNADLILVMNHGDIVEQGNHEELLKKNGFYAKLYNSQFEE